MSNNEWIDWHGGEQPVDDNALVDIWSRDGEAMMGGVYARNLQWDHTYGTNDIIRYRLAPPRPRTVTIDGEVFEVPEPLRERPKQETSYWYIVIEGGEVAVASWPWVGSLEDAHKLRNWQVYATQADAEKRAAIERKIFGVAAKP